jgi:hypothetical protein
MRTGIAALIGAVLVAVVMAEVSTSKPATTEAEAVTRLERRVAALERRVAALERVARLQVTINRVAADQMRDALDQQIFVTSYLTGIASVPPRTGAKWAAGPARADNNSSEAASSATTRLSSPRPIWLPTSVGKWPHSTRTERRRP